MPSNPQNAIDFHQELAPKWNQKYERQIFEQRAERLTSALAEAVGTGEKWIDAGCGTGTISRILVDMGVTVTGFDGSSKMIEIAISKSESQIKEGVARFELVETIEELPSESGSIDGIICSSVIEYLDNPKVCLAEFNRALKTGGKLVLTAPNRLSLLAVCLKAVFWITCTFTRNPRPAYMRFSRNHYSGRELESLLSKCGFDVVKLEYTSFWPNWIRHKCFGGMCIYQGTKAEAVEV